MIGCPCGGFAEATAERRKGMALEYVRCRSCGRCDRWRLKQNGELIAKGESARRAYIENQEAAP